MALAGGMLAMFGLLSLVLIGVLAGTRGGGLLSLTENGDQSAARQTQSTAAFNIADSGVEYTLQWLHTLPSPPNVSRAFQLPAWNGQPNDPGVVYPLGAGTFTVWIFPDALNNAPINNNTGQGAIKKYLIQSTGTSGGVSQTVQAYVQQTSFGSYAVFVDSTPPNAYWASGTNVFDGPVHSNNSDNGSPATANGPLNNIVWNDGTGSGPVAPVFTYRGSDAFTVSGPSVNWYRNNYGSSSAPVSEAEWKMIATAGSSGVHTGVPMIPMPGTDLTQQYVAMGQTPPPPGSTTPPSGLPTTIGVLVPSSGGLTTGGMYIHGPVQQMTLSVDPHNSKTQIIQIQQTDANGNPYTTTLTLTPSASPPTTQVHVAYLQQSGGVYRAATTDNTYTGVTNGVVYSDSDIGSQTSPKTGGITGVVADKSTLTIATDPGHNVNIDGSITYNTPRQKDGSGHPLPESDPSNAAFLASAGMLGIVSQNVEVVDNDTSGNPITNIEVDAAVMASGTATASTYDACDYGHRPPGAMLNMGSYIVKTRGIFNTGSNGNVVNGIACSRYYDNRLASHPPPFFPTTSSQYTVLSWQRVAAPL